MDRLPSLSLTKEQGYSPPDAFLMLYESAVTHGTAAVSPTPARGSGRTQV